MKKPPSVWTAENYPARIRTLNNGTKIRCVTVTPRGTGLSQEEIYYQTRQRMQVTPAKILAISRA